MKMLKLGFACVTFGFLGGCAAAGVTGLPADTAEKNFAFDKSYDEVWEATVESVSYTHLTLPTNREV